MFTCFSLFACLEIIRQNVFNNYIVFHSSLFSVCLFCFCSTLRLFVARKKLRKIGKLLFLFSFARVQSHYFSHFARSHFYSQVFNVCVSFNMYIYFLVFVLFFFSLFVCIFRSFSQLRGKKLLHVWRKWIKFFSDFFFSLNIFVCESVCVFVIVSLNLQMFCCLCVE